MAIDQVAGQAGAFISPSAVQPARGGGGDFAARLDEAVGQVNQAQLNADTELSALASGKSSDLHGVMIALQEADITIRAMVSVRDKAVDAYQAVMNMSI